MVRVQIRNKDLKNSLKADLYKLKVLGYKENQETSVLTYPEELDQDVEEVFVRHEVRVKELSRQNLKQMEIPEPEEVEFDI